MITHIAESAKLPSHQQVSDATGASRSARRRSTTQSPLAARRVHHLACPRAIGKVRSPRGHLATVRSADACYSGRVGHSHRTNGRSATEYVGLRQINSLIPQGVFLVTRPKKTGQAPRGGAARGQPATRRDVRPDYRVRGAASGCPRRLSDRPPPTRRRGNAMVFLTTNFELSETS